MVQDNMPQEIVDAGLQDWYSSLNDPTKVKVRRYLQGIDTSSPEALLIQLMDRSTEDHNYKLSAAIGQYALSRDLDDYQRFKVTESYIDGLFGADMFDEAKAQCCHNLDIFPAVRDRVLADNGGNIPKHLACRNRLIDIMVGVESDYDGAVSILDDFVGIGIMDPDELDYRKQSLKIHRLQKSFDNLFIYRPKE